MLLKRDNLEAAKDAFEEFLTKIKKDNAYYSEEKSIPVISTMTFCYIRLKNYDKGFANLYKILKFNPEFEKAHRIIIFIFNRTTMLQEKEYEGRKNIEALKPIIKTFQDDDSFASNLILAVLYWMEKNHDEMFLHLKKVEKLMPDNAYLPYYFAEYHRLRREFDEAVRSFDIFLDSKPEVGDAYTSMIECFYEKSFDLLRQGKYEDAKFCLDNGIKISKSFRRMPQIKKGKHNPEQLFLRIIEEEMDIFKKFILFDYQFERIFTACSLDELCKTALMVFEYLKSLGLLSPKEYILSETARNLFFKKMDCLFVILNALRFFKKMNQTEAKKYLRKARQFFLNENFIFGKQAVDSIETFITALTQYESSEEIPKEKEAELISLLQPGYVLARGLTLFVAERQKSDLSSRKELISSVRDEIKNSLKIRTIAEKPKNKKPEAEKAEYEEEISLEKSTLEIDYLNEEPIIRINGKIVEEFKTHEVFFARFVRLAVARKVNELERNGRIYKYDAHDKTKKSKNFNLYIGGFRQKNEEKKQVQDRSKKRDKELYDLRKFLEKECKIYGLTEEMKKKLIISRKGSNEVNLEILQENIIINMEDFKKFKSNLRSVQSDKYGTLPSEITERLIKDAIEAYKNHLHKI